jgi:hypothetical protein
MIVQNRYINLPVKNGHSMMNSLEVYELGSAWA